MGAQPVQVIGAMTRVVLVPVAVGLAAGVAGAIALGRLVSSFLYGIQPTDIVTATATSALAIIAGVTSFVPAWRAAAVSPAEVLSAE